MKLKKKIIALTATFSVSLCSLWASPPPPPPPPHPHIQPMDSNSLIGELFDMCIDLFWAANNLSVEFDSYPYASGEKYIQFLWDAVALSNSVMDDKIQNVSFQTKKYSKSSYSTPFGIELLDDEYEYFEDDTDFGDYDDISPSPSISSSVTDDDDDYYETESSSTPYAAKSYRYAVDTSIFVNYANITTCGLEGRFEGYIWKFFGPYIEFKRVWPDFNANINIDTLAYGYGDFRLGFQFSIFHSNPFSLAYFMTWDHLYGEMKGNGAVFGLIVRSYPVKPLLLEWRGDIVTDANLESKGDFVSSSSDRIAFESHLEAGVMIASSRAELFAYWNYCYEDYEKIETNGFGGGIRVHF